MTSPLLTDPALSAVYARSRVPVAFIDESHDAVAGAGGVGFYTTAAVIVDRRRFENLRTAILQAAGGRPWHTTDVFHAGHPEPIAALATHWPSRSSGTSSRLTPRWPATLRLTTCRPGTPP